MKQGSLTRIAPQSDLSPKGEVRVGQIVPQLTSPLGEGAPGERPCPANR